jgi:hypothetical protein
VDQSWFEMGDIRRRKLKNSVWIPLRAIKEIQDGRYGYAGYKKEFCGTGSIAVPVDKKESAEKLGWRDIGIIPKHSGVYWDSGYTPVDVYEGCDRELLGLHLVLDQHFNSMEVREWHLHQDFAITLGLKRENDVWVCPNEGYVEVVHLCRSTDGRPILLEVRAEYLKDYLCARGMGLYVTSFYSRDIVTEDASFIDWKDGSKDDKTENDRWEGRVIEIHEGGHSYGGSMAVFHIARTDVDESDDIPDISGITTDENTISSSWERKFEGRKLYGVLGELWRNEWIDPAQISQRIKEDKLPPSVFFIVDEVGNKASKDSLVDAGKWLWFRPDVIMALAHRRGGSLSWYTRDTGSVSCSPDYHIQFGINGLGLVNVYAKDLVLLPVWQQQIWAGYNISPEGGVSEELLASQVRAQPANTQAPEEFLKRGLRLVNTLAQDRLNIALFKEHAFIPELLERTHRFRAVDEAGLYALAKDVARLTADSLDTAAIQSIVSPPKKTNWGSLKSLENLIALKIDSEKARSMMSALVGVYELRHADAHLPSSEIDEAFALLKVDRSLPTVLQGYQLLHSCVSSIWGTIEVLQRWDELDGDTSL